MKYKTENFQNRVSSRNYCEYELTLEEIKLISEAINNSPTHSNHQLFSAVIVLDKNKRNAISKKLYNQKHICSGSGYILFLADRSRSEIICKETNICNDISTYEFMRSFMDASIASSYAQSALMTMGFGTCYLGAQFVLKDFYKEILNIPENSFPVVGLSFGKILSKNKFKPKINKVFIDKYEKNISERHLEKYNNNMKKYFEIDRSKNIDFFNHVKSFYKNKYYIEYSKKANNILEKEIKNLIK